MKLLQIAKQQTQRIRTVFILPQHIKKTRAYQLATTAAFILFKQGPHAFSRRLQKWLQGERRYHIKSSTYQDFIRWAEPDQAELRRQRTVSALWGEKLLFSIVTPIYAPPLAIFQELAQTILDQTYENWEWIAADASPNDEVWNYLKTLAAQDARIIPVRIQQNRGISTNTNIAISHARGDYIVLADHDDTLATHALFEVASLIREHPDADLIYSDEDKLDEQGKRCEPAFKPDWSPEMMICANVVTHLAVFRRSLLDTVGLLNPQTDGAQDWDLFLRMGEHTDHIYHIPDVLYHWRKTASSTAQNTYNKDVQNAQRSVILNHLRRRYDIQAEVVFDPMHPIHAIHPRVYWQPRQVPLVSIIIPSIDHADVLGKCLQTLYDLTEYPHYEVIVVDTGSIDPATFDLYRRYEKYSNFQVVYDNQPFNFSKACNRGSTEASGDLLLFLNNDVEITHSDWLTRMVQWFDLDGVGIVGAKLLYPTGTIQHAGVVLGINGLASHLFIHQYENSGSIFVNDDWYLNLSAVTGACLLIARSVFETVEGFDEEYRLNYSDVELCLQVHEAGYRIVYTPDARLIHHESVTHQRRVPRADFERASKQWQQWLQRGDPYFNPNLSMYSALPTLRRDRQDTAYQANQKLMRRLPSKEMILLPDDLRYTDRDQNQNTIEQDGNW